MELETKRFLIRSLRVEDVATLAKLWTNPDVTRFMGGPRNYEEVHAELMKDARLVPSPKYDLWAVIEKVTGDIAGHCGIIDKDIENTREFELVYVIDKSSWGKGYATEISSAIKDFAVKVGLKYERDLVRPGGKNMQLYSLKRDNR
jgi:ribosomal-protein-alanine N-acetyltransferase